MHYVLSFLVMLFQFWILVSTVAYPFMIRKYTLSFKQLLVFIVSSALLVVFYYLLEMYSRNNVAGFLSSGFYKVLYDISIIDLIIWIIYSIISVALGGDK